MLAVAIMIGTLIPALKAQAFELDQEKFFQMVEDPNFTIENCVQVAANTVAAGENNNTSGFTSEEIVEIEKECKKLKNFQKEIVAEKALLKEENPALYESIPCIYNRWKAFTEYGIEDKHWDPEDAVRLGPGADRVWRIIVLREKSNSIYQKLLNLDPDGEICRYIFTFQQSVSCPPTRPPTYVRPPEPPPQRVSEPIPRPMEMVTTSAVETQSAFCPCMWVFDANGTKRSKEQKYIECYNWSILPSGVTLADIEDVWLVGDFNHWVDAKDRNPPTLKKLKSWRFRKYRIPRMSEDGVATFSSDNRKGRKFIKAMTHIKESRWLFVFELKNGTTRWASLDNFAFDDERSWACGVFQQESGAVMSLYTKTWQTTSRHRISAMEMGE